MNKVIRVTKWLPSSDLSWCNIEAKRISKSTGDKCQIVRENKNKNSRIAINRYVGSWI